jgi:hypothetical protein
MGRGFTNSMSWSYTVSYLHFPVLSVDEDVGGAELGERNSLLVQFLDDVD